MPAARCASPLSWAPRAAAALLVALACLVAGAVAQRRAELPDPHQPHHRSGGAVERRRLYGDPSRARRARAEVDRPGRRRHAQVPRGLSDRGLRLSARAQMGHRPEGQGQRHPAHRRAQRAQSAHRGRPRAGARDDRRDVEPHHPERHPAGVPPRRLFRRHPRRRARHQRRAARRRRGGQGARAAGEQRPRLLADRHSSSSGSASSCSCCSPSCSRSTIRRKPSPGAAAGAAARSPCRATRGVGAAAGVGGGSGGGGWSGGGGDFGGGGSSGSW